MDTSSKRKFSLDSKSSSGQYDLRFTRRKLNTNYKWCCCGIATFLLMLLLASTALYLAYYAMETEQNTLMSFRANFRVIDGDNFDASLIDTNSTSYRKKSRNYRELINLLIRKSEHKNGFIGSEILALDGVEESGMSVHFKLHYDQQRSNVTSEALRNLFHRLLNKSAATRSQQFNKLTFDPHSLYVGEPGISDTSLLPPTLEVSGGEVEAQESEDHVVTEAPRVCVRSRLDFCNHDNMTSYPNVFGHTNQQQVNEDIVRFREIVDSECSPPESAFSLICELLQPSCEPTIEDSYYNLTLPCKTRCQEFMNNCQTRLPQDIKNILNSCENFTNVDC